MWTQVVSPLTPRLRRLPLMFADLKRRRVFHTMAVYGAVSFASLEAFSLIQPVLLVPEWVYRGAGFVVLGGFPIAVVLTWLYDFNHDVVLTPPASPEELEAIVRAPRHRRWPSGVLALVGVILVGAAGWYGTGVGATPSERSTTIAVLPLVNRSALPEDRFFVDGLHDELLLRLAQERRLHVTSRTSVQQFGGTTLPIAVVADSLGVAMVLEGAVQRAGDTVRVSLQLIRADRDDHVWSRGWDMPLEPDRYLSAQSIVSRQAAETIARVLRSPAG